MQNLAWCCTQITKLFPLYRQQWRLIRLLSFKDQFAYSRPLFKEISALSMYKISIFDILCLMYKCEKKACPEALEKWLTLKPRIKSLLNKVPRVPRVPKGPNAWAPECSSTLRAPKCLSAWVPKCLELLSNTWLPKCPSVLSAWVTKCPRGALGVALECPWSALGVLFEYSNFIWVLFE